jgi:hypothetical protein
MRRFALPVLLAWPVLVSGVSADSRIPLNPRQTILEADRHLIADGWQPSPEQIPSLEERRLAAVDLKSLSACSGTGLGFCRFDYVRDAQRLSVVTVPSQPGQPSVGRVERWW